MKKLNKNKETYNERFGNCEILSSTCNISTVNDGRGGIFTWCLQDKIVEVNLIYYHPNKVRGNHYHPEFNEYWILIDGFGLKVTPNPKTGEPLTRHIGGGTCLRIPKNTSHAFHPITEAKAISMLTRYWDDCEEPIIHEDLVPMDKDYQKYAEEQGFKHSIEEIIKKKK